MSAVRRVDGRRRRRGVLDRRHAGPRPREDLALHGDGARRLAEAEAHGRRARVADRRERERVGINQITRSIDRIRAREV